MINSKGYKIAFLLLCSVLLLGACGQNAKESTSASQPAFDSNSESEVIETLEPNVDLHQGRESENGLWPFDDLAALGEITLEDNKYIISWDKPRTVGFVRVVWENMPPEEYYVKYGDEGADSFSLIKAFKAGSYLSDVSVDLSEQKCKVVTTDRIMVQSKTDLKIKDVQVYSENPWKIIWDNLIPQVREDSDGDGFRELVLTEAGLTQIGSSLIGGLDNINIVMAGSDLEEVITPASSDEGIVNNNIQDRKVVVGYRVTTGSWSTESPEIEIEVPAIKSNELYELSGENEIPAVVPGIQEWIGDSGNLNIKKIKRILIGADPMARQAAEILVEDMKEKCGKSIEIEEGDIVQYSDGDIVLALTHEAMPLTHGLGSEGYVIQCDKSIRIYAEDYSGLFYGTRTLLQQLERNGAVVCGIMRDYPTYETRGFGIDVARKRVSLDTIYTILDEMADYKLNDLNLHLNDNTILNSSNASDLEKTLSLYSAFRLESDIVGSVKPITAQDLFYTKEDFIGLVAYAKARGINIVPEFDTPAHSLAFTSASPELGQKNAGNADMFDLTNPESQKFVENLWAEYLEGGDHAVFADCDTVHIGGDEYGGDSNLYLNFENAIIDYVESYGKTARIWGSLSYITGDVNVKSQGVEMMLWSEKWADPLTMYQAGFDMVNCNEGQMYIIPGGTRSKLNTRLVYDGYEVNQYLPGGTKVKLPRYSGQLKGGSYILWNDRGNDESISEQDLIDGFADALPYVSQKVWRVEKTFTYDELQSYIPD